MKKVATFTSFFVYTCTLLKWIKVSTMHAKTPCGRWEPHFRVSWPLRNFVSFGAPARSAATMLQRRGGLQGGSPPCTDFFLILGKIGTFSEAFFSTFCVYFLD